MSDQSPQKTHLYDWHQKKDAKIVAFAGYALALTYPLGLRGEHEACRNAAALFDVSHMGQVHVEGAQAVAYLNRLLPLDCEALAIGNQSYSFLLNEQGKVLDDLMCARLGPNRFKLVVNGACKVRDLEHMGAIAADFDVTLEVHDASLIALQGPRAAQALTQTDLAQATQLKFMQMSEPVPGYTVSRSGYTGEDGFEISVPNESVANLCDQLCALDFVEPAGLGARDSLRLEAGLHLYGQDLWAEISPLDAGLGWAVPKGRGGFVGAQAIATQRENGADYACIALLPEGRAPLRTGDQLFDLDDQHIGKVTSGLFSPTLGRPIALASVKRSAAKATQFVGQLRGRPVICEKTKLPFVKKSYAK